MCFKIQHTMNSLFEINYHVLLLYLLAFYRIIFEDYILSFKYIIIEINYRTFFK